MARELKPEITSELLGINPFVAGLVIPVYVSKTGAFREWENEDGDKILLPDSFDLDTEPHFKSYVSVQNRNITIGLPYRPLQIWTWITQTIKPGEDYLWIPKGRTMKECRMKCPKTFMGALKLLARYGFIAPCMNVRDVYFINPAMGFRGSRVKKFPDNVVKTNQ